MRLFDLRVRASKVQDIFCNRLARVQRRNLRSILLRASEIPDDQWRPDENKPLTYRCQLGEKELVLSQSGDGWHVHSSLSMDRYRIDGGYTELFPQTVGLLARSPAIDRIFGRIDRPYRRAREIQRRLVELRNHREFVAGKMSQLEAAVRDLS